MIVSQIAEKLLISNINHVDFYSEVRDINEGKNEVEGYMIWMRKDI